MKLLRPFTGTGAVFFPVGMPPVGTCCFATPDCVKACYAIDPNDVDFDEELKISESTKGEIKSYFVLKDVDIICAKIIEDLDGLQTPILHWFGSGDCPLELLDKISLIIKSLPKNIAQMGFTRNKKMWKEHKDIFALTIETKEEATDDDGLYSIPNYKEQVSMMYSPRYQVRGGYCGPLICRDISRDRRYLDHYINCRTCLRLKTGCFDRR